MAVTIAALGSAIPAADAARRPSQRERAAIKRVAMKVCPRECDYRGARVSTRGRRYAWADVVGEGFSGVLLKRPSRHSRHFRVIGTQGGGISLCSEWRPLAPARVLRDLHIRGLIRHSGKVRNCGRRR